MDQLYTYEILQELRKTSFDDNWGLLIEIVVQGLVLYLTIKYSVKLSKDEFERQRNLDSVSEKEVDSQAKEIVVYSLERELDNLEKLNSTLRSYTSLNSDNIKTAPLLVFNASFIDSINNIDLLRMSRLLEPFRKINRDVNVVQFTTTLNSLKSYYNEFGIEHEKFDYYCNTTLNELDRTCIDLIGEVFKIQHNPKMLSLSQNLEGLFNHYFNEVKRTEQLNKNYSGEGIKSTGVSNSVRLAEGIIAAMEIQDNGWLVGTKLYSSAQRLILTNYDFKSKIAQFESDTQNRIVNMNKSVEIIKLYHHILKNNS